MFSVPQERVFNARASSEAMSSSFGLGEGMQTNATVDFQEGCSYTIVAGPYTVRGSYQEIPPYDKISFTWNWDEDQDVPEMLVTITFESSTSGTKMTLIHERIAGMERLEQHKAAWEVALERLAKQLDA